MSCLKWLNGALTPTHRVVAILLTYSRKPAAEPVNFVIFDGLSFLFLRKLKSVDLTSY